MRTSYLLCYWCCALSVIASVALLPLDHALPARIARGLMAVTRPYRMPTAAIYDLLAAIERNNPSELTDFADRMQTPASLHILIAERQLARHQPNLALGPYRAPDWPMPGARLTIPLRFTCHHRANRLEVVVRFTLSGWQIDEIRLPG
ncbi:hypothetical protein [Chloroflexus sp.]|uniref:hypothetical protein n=1 Tax=Chloroflexus sp. TaxID=1904827 RepID=UPI002622B584|nr:hypothetical protein [uncultured Chloroflexus sp.]